MARFILDVANISEDTCNAVMNAIIGEVPIVAEGISTLHCIDKTNNNQFYDDPNRNKLSQSQIDNYNLQLKQEGYPQNSTLENNKLIAEFMGLSHSSGWLTPSEPYVSGQNMEVEDMKYHKSWDWLIPVMKKIDTYANEEMSIAEYDDYRNKYILIAESSIYNGVSYIHKQVVEFIKDYNKNN